jgi:hypothetical protein
LLYAAGYEVGRYISLERIIEGTKKTYYEALLRSSQRPVGTMAEALTCSSLLRAGAYAHKTYPQRRKAQVNEIVA